MNFLIRTEAPQDNKAVYDLVTAAFLGAEHTDGDEQNLVERLRKSAAFVPRLSLVAERDGVLIGHALFTELKVGEKTELGLAPLSVAPAHQGCGVGLALMAEGHRIAAELGYGVSVVLGHPAYYPRAGYESATAHGITCPFEVPEECFLVRELAPGGLDGARGGVTYPPEFGL